ncbi:MAG: hypothetical protein RQ824_04770 [bacterium]|nr:hypothetical protein [bacterium]
MKDSKGLIMWIALSLLFFTSGCEQKSDSVSDAVMAPWRSTVEMGAAVSAMEVVDPTDTWFVEYRIRVLDASGNPMNGIGINLQTSSPYAIFQNSLTSIDLVKTGEDGSVLVVVWVYGGQYFNTYPSQTDLKVQVFADIVVDSAVSDITVTNSLPSS